MLQHKFQISCYSSKSEGKRFQIKIVGLPSTLPLDPELGEVFPTTKDEKYAFQFCMGVNNRNLIIT